MITVTTREDFLIELNQLLPNKCVGVELGVLHGDFSSLVLNAVDIRRLYLIDAYIKVTFLFTAQNQYGEELELLSPSYSTEEDYQNLLKRFKDEIEHGRIVVDRRYSHAAVTDYADKKFDFIYIDSCHLYECVKKDLSDWLPKLKDCGYMCGHDYIDFSNFGVIEAVNEFCEQHNFEMIIFNDNGGDWALKKN